MFDWLFAIFAWWRESDDVLEKERKYLMDED